MTGYANPQPYMQVPSANRFWHYSTTVGALAVQLFPDLPNTTGYVRISNISPAGGANLWISRYLGQATAPGAPGAIELPPGAFEEFRIPARIPLNGVWAIADAASGCAVTAEVG